MNHFQNFGAGKFFSQQKIEADFSDLYGSDEKRRKFGARNRERLDNSRPGGALKIFYESKNFNIDESSFEWNFKSKKSCRSIAQKETDESKKVKKNKKKVQRRDNVGETDSKRTGCIAAKDFAGKTAPLGGPKTEDTARLSRGSDSPFLNYLTDRVDLNKFYSVGGKQESRAEFEKTSLTSSFAQSRPSADSSKRHEKLELVVRSRRSSQTLSRKTSEKSANKLPEVNSTISDFGKRHINEILKNHAQKFQNFQVKTFQIKECPIQEVAEFLEEVTRASASGKGANAAKDEATERSKGKNEKDEGTKQEDGKEKSPEKSSKSPKEAKENSREGDPHEEKKKLPEAWMKQPQSNELKRRLVPSWQEPRAPFMLDKDMKSEGSEEEERKSRKSDRASPEEERRPERRTYTDRLLIAKNLDVTKQLQEIEAKWHAREMAKENEKKTSPEAARKADAQLSCRPQDPKLLPGLATKEVSEDSMIRRTRESESVIKTKPTRSTELRDLVSQAIKDHKIFCIFDNHTYIGRPVREELLSRGWLEVIPDRRLIPRRRPPPMGPMYERDKMAVERNCNALEAILTAKENFADEIQESVSKSSSFRLTMVERSKPTFIVSKKSSEDSLNEVLSQFRIIPPTSEKKKNNYEIREFLAKYQAHLEKEKERDKEIKQLREKSSKNLKKETSKTENHSMDASLDEEINLENPSDDYPPVAPAVSKSLEEILKTINENKKVIALAASEIKNFEEKMGGKTTIGVIYDPRLKNYPSIAGSEASREETRQDSSRTSFTESEAKTISKIIQSTNARIHFMWLSIKPAIHLKCFNYSPEIVNKFQKTTFCTKIGLWSHLNNIQWYAHEVNFPAKSPRMYNTGEADDLQAFFQDFQLTACMGMLKWLSDTFFERGLKAVQTKRGKVPLKAFEFAIKQCERYIRFKDNEDLSLLDEPKIRQEEWNTFLQWFYTITNDHGKVQESSSGQLMVVYTKAVETLKTMRRHWPEIDIDGRLNIWIMKPYCASCGRGIFMTNNVYYIGQHSKYIVQKYIERPFLIYNTKFDIRQWFMVTKLTPLEIWMYKECYLRFCSQPFALRNLHESVHLSNNSVQRKYISYRDSSLPDQNMWDSATFQLYLRTIGHPSVWDDVIYPGMKDAIVSTMLASQDTFDGPRKSWFEVYGADFMLSSNLREGPWLIEINENPAMDPSTKVTARLCPQMLRDVIKVVVDKRSNKNASTGQWELIYRQNYSPSFSSVDLDVRGKKVVRITHAAKFRNSSSRRRKTETPCPREVDGGRSPHGEQSSRTRLIAKLREHLRALALQIQAEQRESVRGACTGGSSATKLQGISREIKNPRFLQTLDFLKKENPKKNIK